MTDEDYVKVPVTLGYDQRNVCGTLSIRKDIADRMMTDYLVLAPGGTFEPVELYEVAVIRDRDLKVNPAE